MAKQHYNPEPFKSVGRPYAMAVKAGKLVFLAGQLGVEFIDGVRTVVAPGDAARQVERIFVNMQGVLAEAKAELKDICWLQFFVTNMDDKLAMDPVRRRFFALRLLSSRLMALAGFALPR